MNEPAAYLLPPTNWDGDLVRAITVDGDQVYYRNLREGFRIPLEGGQPTLLSKAPGLILSGQGAQFWVQGDRLLTQSSAEAVFLESPKSGGEWSIFLGSQKAPGGRDAATRILANIGGKGNATYATEAAFDGENFYWAERPRLVRADQIAPSTIKTIPLAGGTPRTLFESPGEIDAIVKADQRLGFVHVVPTPGAKSMSGKPGETYLSSIPLAGGEVKNLMHAEMPKVLAADGTDVFVGAYWKGDFTKGGLYRVDTTGTRAPELFDPTVFAVGKGFVSRDQVVFVGTAPLEIGKPKFGVVVLAGERNGKGLRRVACIETRSSVYAGAVTDGLVLVALYEPSTNQASIAKIPIR